MTKTIQLLKNIGFAFSKEAFWLLFSETVTFFQGQTQWRGHHCWTWCIPLMARCTSPPKRWCTDLPRTYWPSRATISDYCGFGPSSAIHMDYLVISLHHQLIHGALPQKSFVAVSCPKKSVEFVSHRSQVLVGWKSKDTWNRQPLRLLTMPPIDHANYDNKLAIAFLLTTIDHDQTLLNTRLPYYRQSV